MRCPTSEGVSSEPHPSDLPLNNAAHADAALEVRIQGGQAVHHLGLGSHDLRYFDHFDGKGCLVRYLADALRPWYPRSAWASCLALPWVVHRALILAYEEQQPIQDIVILCQL